MRNLMDDNRRRQGSGKKVMPYQRKKKSLALENRLKRTGRLAPEEEQSGNYPLAAILKSQALFGQDLKKRSIELRKQIAHIFDGDDHSQRNQRKRDYVEEHREYVKAFLASNMQGRNMIVAYWIVFCFDSDLSFAGTNYFHEFATIAPVAVVRRQGTPPDFKRSLGEFYFDSILKWAENQREEKRTPEPYLSEAIERIGKEHFKIPNPLEAKFYKLKARIVRDYSDLEEPERSDQTVFWFKRAEITYDKVQVKTERIKAQELNTKWYQQNPGALEAEPVEKSEAEVVPPAEATESEPVAEVVPKVSEPVETQEQPTDEPQADNDSTPQTEPE